MKKLMYIVFALAIACLFVNVVGYIQHDHYETECVSVYTDVYGNDIAVFEIGSHTYEWELEDKTLIHKGDLCKVTMFDFENGDQTDDIITDVKILSHSKGKGNEGK